MLINNSDKLNQSEKDSFYNYELLSSVIPYYIGTNMVYAIKSRLDNFGIIYGDTEERSAGYYAYSNEIVLDKEFEKVAINDNYKKSVASHEFVHLLQAQCPSYIKESSAEIISSEFFDRNAFAYSEACFNLKLLVEIMGPKVLWNYIFSGDDTQFNNFLKRNLDINDYDKLTHELEKSPFYDNPNHELITSIIHKLYKNIYDENMVDNRDIYDFDGNYIDKLYFKKNDNSFSKIIYCNKEEAIKQGIGELDTFYLYEKPISYQEFYDFLENNDSVICQYDNKSCEVCIKSKDKSKIITYYNFDGKKFKVSISNEEKVYDFNYDSLKELSNDYNFYYEISTSDKKEVNDPNMILVSEFESLKSKNI